METLLIGHGIPLRVMVMQEGVAWEMRKSRCLRCWVRNGEDGAEYAVQDVLYDDYTNTVMVRLCSALLPDAGTYQLKIEFTDYNGHAVGTGWFDAVEVAEDVPLRCVVVEVTAEAEYI